MYKCKHFQIYELVPPDIYKKRDEKAWELLDKKLLITLDLLRDKFGPMKINDYRWDGDRMWSGIRTPDSEYYSPTSQHTFGRAADIIFKDVSVDEVRNDIIYHQNATMYRFINAIELNVPWLHIDTRNCRRIKTFSK